MSFIYLWWGESLQIQGKYNLFINSLVGVSVEQGSKKRLKKSKKKRIDDPFFVLEQNEYNTNDNSGRYTNDVVRDMLFFSFCWPFQ